MPIQDLTQFFQRFSDNPAYRFGLKLLENDRVLQGLDGMLQYKDWKGLLVLQLIAAVVVMLFRSWRMSLHEPGHWFGRFWTAIWTSVVGWVFLLFIVPYFSIGRPYVDLWAGIIEVARNQPLSP